MRISDWSSDVCSSDLGEVGWAFQLQNPYVILSLTALMAIITFNLVGMFELPSISIGGGLMMRDGAGGAFWTGALTAFIATPCSGPFMGLAIDRKSTRLNSSH